MATFRNKKKLAAVARECQNEYPRNSQSGNTVFTRINEDYITPEEMEGSVPMKFSLEFIAAESEILGALSKLDEFLPNPQVEAQSRIIHERPGILTQETRNQMMTAPRMIPVVLK